MERKARSSLLLFLFLFWSSRATRGEEERSRNKRVGERTGERMEKRSYFPRIPEAVGLSRRHSSYVDSILTDIAGNPVRRVRHTDTGPFCKTANRPIDGAPTRGHPSSLLPRLSPPPSPPHHPYPSYARSCRLFAIEATFAGGTVPLGGHAACNAAECRKWNYAKSRGGTMRAETMHEARKRRDGRENVAPSPFIRIADSEARTTVPCFSLAFQNARCATRRKGNYSRDLLLPILSKVQTRLIRLREVTGLGCGEAIVEKSIGGNFDYFFFIRSIRSNNFVI